MFARAGSARVMRVARASQSTVAATSPTAWRSSAASFSSRAGSAGEKGLKVPSSRIDLSLRVVASKKASEHAAELPPRLVKVPPNRTGRELHHLADLGARHSVHLEHRDDEPLALGER